MQQQQQHAAAPTAYPVEGASVPCGLSLSINDVQDEGVDDCGGVCGDCGLHEDAPPELLPPTIDNTSIAAAATPENANLNQGVSARQLAVHGQGSTAGHVPLGTQPEAAERPQAQFAFPASAVVTRGDAAAGTSHGKAAGR
jgi:hypothetical protein